MNVEAVKYIIWAADAERCAKFYVEVLGGEMLWFGGGQDQGTKRV